MPDPLLILASLGSTYTRQSGEFDDPVVSDNLHVLQSLSAGPGGMGAGSGAGTFRPYEV